MCAVCGMQVCGMQGGVCGAQGGVCAVCVVQVCSLCYRESLLVKLMGLL